MIILAKLRYLGRPGRRAATVQHLARIFQDGSDIEMLETYRSLTAADRALWDEATATSGESDHAESVGGAT